MINSRTIAINGSDVEGAFLGPIQQSGVEGPRDAVPEESPRYSEDGVDLTLIRWMLSLTPDERLEVLQQHIRAIQSLRDANPHL